jgi:hypothetical protein
MTRQRHPALTDHDQQEIEMATQTTSTDAPSAHVTRRAVLKAAPAVAIAAAIPATAPASAKGADAAILQAWATWQAGHREMRALQGDLPAEHGSAYSVEENRLWAIIDAAVERIRATTARSPRDVAIQLCIALCHTLTTDGAELALIEGNTTAIHRTDAEQDWETRLTLAALRSLEAMEA